MIPTRNQLPTFYLIISLLAAFVALSALLRATLPSDTAETLETAVILGAIAAAFVWGRGKGG